MQLNDTIVVRACAEGSSGCQQTRCLVFDPVPNPGKKLLRVVLDVRATLSLTCYGGWRVF